MVLISVPIMLNSSARKNTVQVPVTLGLNTGRISVPPDTKYEVSNTRANRSFSMCSTFLRSSSRCTACARLARSFSWTGSSTSMRCSCISRLLPSVGMDVIRRMMSCSSMASEMVTLGNVLFSGSNEIRKSKRSERGVAEGAGRSTSFSVMTSTMRTFDVSFSRRYFP